MSGLVYAKGTTPLISVTPEVLGFEPIPTIQQETLAWHKSIGDQTVIFRALRQIEEMQSVEMLQRDVLSLSDLDVVAASALVSVFETGGEVLGAFVASESGEQPAGVSVGYGGYHHHRPRLVSDFLGVLPQYRSLGLGTELKRLQAALAIERGLEEITWTVDPLRAANARMNFEKLGAYARRYEIDRYRSTFAPGLYGGMPTDRLHVTWPIWSDDARALLITGNQPRDRRTTTGPPVFQASTWTSGQAKVLIPPQIDVLVHDAPDQAIQWRMQTRESLLAALAAGLVVTGFLPATASDNSEPALLLEPFEILNQRLGSRGEINE